MTWRQLNMESAVLLSTAVNLPYRLVVNHFDLDQVALFGESIDCLKARNRELVLEFRFDSGVLKSALELERRATLALGQRRPLTTVFRCESTKFVLVFALSRDSKVFGGREGDGGGDSSDNRAMTESQAEETVQVLRRIRESLGGEFSPREVDFAISSICTRFEVLRDLYAWRNMGGSKAARDAHFKRIGAARRVEEAERFEAVQRRRVAKSLEAAPFVVPPGRLVAAERLEPAPFVVPPGRLGAAERLARFEQMCAAMVAEDETASSHGVTSEDEFTSGVEDSGSDSDGGVELSPHQLASGRVKD